MTDDPRDDEAPAPDGPDRAWRAAALFGPTEPPPGRPGGPPLTDRTDPADPARPADPTSPSEPPLASADTTAPLPSTPPTTPTAAPGGRRGLVLLAGVLLGAVMGGAVGGWVALSLDDDPVAADRALPATLPRVENPGDVREIVEAIAPSMVSIQTQSVGSDAFGGVLRPMPQQGAGSGFIVTPDGVIVTNAHVIEGASQITVVFADGSKKPATVLGSDPSRDLAVLDVEGDDLPAAPIGDSSELRVGDTVVAIGNALSLDGAPTVTQGIVSALDRTITVGPGQNLVGLIQTDAAINPGNSGGALVNSRGEVVGINTAIAGGAENIGFVIPITEVAGTIDQLRSGEVPRQPFLGVNTFPVDEDVARRFDLQVDRGALVVEVTPGTGAEAAGLRSGDVIVRIGSTDIDDSTDLGEAVRGLDPGSTVEIELQRGPDRLTVEATIGERTGSVL